MAEAGSHTVDKVVTVDIQNVEEPGVISLSSVQPQEGTEFTATLEDDDEPTGTTWQWYRTTSRGSSGTAISNANSRFYIPDVYDVGRYLRAVASYDDGHGTGKSASAVSANRVQEAPPVPEPPVFPADGDYDRRIRENLPGGRNIGAPVTATDDNNDRLTYSITASDEFEIVESTGQLRTKAEPDHEGQEQYFVTVTATDPGGLTDTISVTINVEDVDETPVVSGPTSLEFEEGTSTGATLATYTFTDPDREGIDLVLTGTDSEDFTLSSGGVLTFNAVPNFEQPADSGGNNDYRVTIEAREQGDGTSVGRLNVTIDVTNVDEPGVVRTNVEGPRVGQPVRLNVEDEDGGKSVREWKWERGIPNSPCGTVDSPTVPNWDLIPGASGSSYTPTEADQGHCIRATAFYNDRAGTGRTEQFLTTESVETGPFFTQEPPTFRIRENSAEGRDIGRVQARHSNSGETLTYSLSGADAGNFTIDNNGQLKTSAKPPDYETQPGPEAEVQITATDPDNETAIVTVTITVTNVCAAEGEEPCAPGRPSTRYDPDTDTNLLVSWPAPRSDAEITGYDLQYREPGGPAWSFERLVGTDRSHTIGNLVKGTTYEVQVRAMNTHGDSPWSSSAKGRPGVPPPPPPPTPTPPDPEPEKPTTTTTTTTTTTGGLGGGGFAPPPRPAQPAKPVVNRQTVEELFRPLIENGSLGRVWRFWNRWKRWEFYDPDPHLAEFNTLDDPINLAADPPVILIVNVDSSQRFRGYTLRRGWNQIPMEDGPPPPAGSDVQPVGEVFSPLAENGTLDRVWWLDSRTQQWRFFDPDPKLLDFNTFDTVNLAASPPVVAVVNVSRGQKFRGQSLFRGWNYVLLR